MTPDLLPLLRDGGALGILIVVVILLMRGDLVPGWAYKEALRTADRWQELALNGTQLSKDAVSLAKRETR